MVRFFKVSGIVLGVTLLTLFTLHATAGANQIRDLDFPTDPLRSTLGLSFGIHTAGNDSLINFFDRDQLSAWTIRYDYRVWWNFRLGAAVTAYDKSHKVAYINLGGENYPVRYSFSGFQTMGELYLRTQLGRILFLNPHLSVGRVLGRIHVESKGYAEGYDANWQEFRPYREIKQNTAGWRFAAGAQFHFWANMNFLIEGSVTETDLYGGPVDGIPPVEHWDNSGWRLEAGLVQRF